MGSVNMKLLIIVLALLPISIALPFQPLAIEGIAETELEAIGRDDDYSPSWDEYYDDEELELDDYEQEMYNNAMQDAELGATGRDDDDDYYDYEEELELDDDEQEMYDEAMQDA